MHRPSVQQVSAEHIGDTEEEVVVPSRVIGTTPTFEVRGIGIPHYVLAVARSLLSTVHCSEMCLVGILRRISSCPML